MLQLEILVAVIGVGVAVDLLVVLAAYRSGRRVPLLRNADQHTPARVPSGRAVSADRDVRRRSLYVAGGGESPMVFGPGSLARAARMPTSTSLSPELVELLSRSGPALSREASRELVEPWKVEHQAEEGLPAKPEEEPMTESVSGSGQFAGAAAAPGASAAAPVNDYGLSAWEQLVEVENVRLVRYRRPVTVVLAEIDGLSKFAELVGDDSAERLVEALTRVFRRQARSSDWVERIGRNRLAAFMPETDEISAINYVERARTICEPCLESAAVPLVVAIGWASPGPESDLVSAVLQAEERLCQDLVASRAAARSR